MRTEVRGSLAELAPSWDAFVDAGPRPSPFLCSWWLEAVAVGTPTFVLAFEGDELLGGAPLVEERRGGVRRYRLATAGSEHGLDLVAAPGRGDDVADAVGVWLQRAGNRIVDLSGVRPDGALASCAPRAARVEVLETAPWFDVPPTFEDYLASRRKKFRQEIRRVSRRFDELGARYRVVDTDETERAIATLEHLHDQRWDRRSLFRAYFHQFEIAARAGAARGEVRFHELDVAGEVIASLATIERRGTCYFFQMGRNPDPRFANSGTVVKAKAVERACVEGFRKVDLCYGDPATKLLWADEREPVVRVHWGHGPTGRAVHGALMALWPFADALRRLRIGAAGAGRRRREPASAD
ncbi:MAG TPA: GNAT family N-acetyltransferase [Acidimicrobiia bacterium]|nr:GNAT family N-acetyltransferase [Acidimicrobiia bacterium]